MKGEPIDPLWSQDVLLVGDGREFELTEILAAGFLALCPDADPAFGTVVADEYIENQRIDKRNAAHWGWFFMLVGSWSDELLAAKNKQMTSHMVARRLEQIHQDCKQHVELIERQERERALCAARDRPSLGE
ncbi:MAG: hypothetical protein KGL42_00385 [Betaproteobacteria bacterium]|nr:hypothetical protein [Betaproteobacteria bacterium]